MKIQNKAVVIFGIFGITSFFLLGTILFLQDNQLRKDKKAESLLEISIEIASHLESHLIEQSNIAITMSTAPIIRELLLESNAEYSLLSNEERNQEIDTLNQQWINTNDINDPFIQHHLSNAISDFLIEQQNNFPDTFGEIFLTNRYGVMIASTNKLTTLAHFQKYWWQASYADGDGKIFFDDRGYDNSVDGYVLGVVVPIRYDDQIIGILKSNIYIAGLLTTLIQEHATNEVQIVQIVRTNGLIMAKEGVEPLSTVLNEKFIEILKLKTSISENITVDNINQIVSFAPVELTLGSDEYGFGGKYESIDQVNGNTGESWHVVITNDLDALFDTNRESFKFILIFGSFFVVLTALIAFLFGKMVSTPIVDLENLVILDDLTSLYSRRGFFTLANQQMKLSKRVKREMILVYADINGLKIINDTFGHDFGDKAIIGASKILKNTFRDSDIIARIGGDEFAILVLDSSGDSFNSIMERFLEVQTNYNEKSIYDFDITLCIGFSLYHPKDSLSLTNLLKQADELMYIEKEKERRIKISLA